MSDKDIVVEARELASAISNHTLDKQEKLRDLLRALADEVEHARRALKGMVELWDANNPDDPCGCVGASDDCRHPPPCELCVARLIMEGRTNKLFE